MICSSEKRFFTSHLIGIGNWAPNGGATQNRGDVGSSNGSTILRARYLDSKRPAASTLIRNTNACEVVQAT
ncbi:hypothetical protein BRN03_17660 [Xanthomonas oryzae pv. oryzae]|nr:hypothetical protein B9W05_14910 [Xanthomonas oryzae pv. oryzae]AXI18934.1 hypothetical protein CDO19_20660 [Xanthomonas oryzae pv. oryzae]AXI22918.1 hypothetical protein CDO11_20700 [Xanthomonas oryzae pv. oryzae]AXM18528.1 hypothetical protein BRN66_20405 [Xanthomonas oryzae pv. oryzae]AXM22390.1 hypothetical protein BRM88_20950 [Xanthomonas oryzae pv. oryzae]